MASASEGLFRLDFSGLIRARLQDLLRSAAKKGLFDQLAMALKQIEKQLRTDPLNAGEPLYTLGPPPIAMRKIAVRPLVIEYGVMEERRVVMVRDVRSMIDLDV